MGLFSRSHNTRVSHTWAEPATYESVFQKRRILGFFPHNRLLSFPLKELSGNSNKCCYINFEPINGFDSIKYSTDVANSSKSSSLQTTVVLLNTVSSLTLLGESQVFISLPQTSQLWLELSSEDQNQEQNSIYNLSLIAVRPRSLKGRSACAQQPGNRSPKQNPYTSQDPTEAIVNNGLTQETGIQIAIAPYFQPLQLFSQSCPLFPPPPSKFMD